MIIATALIFYALWIGLGLIFIRYVSRAILNGPLGKAELSECYGCGAEMKGGYLYCDDCERWDQEQRGIDEACEEDD